MKALFIGKFQPFHKGHKKAVDLMKKLFDENILVIGSPEQKGYFNIAERKEMVFRNTGIKPIEVKDIKKQDKKYCQWSKFVLKKVGKIDFIVTGNEKVKNSFSELGLPCLWLPRYDNIKGRDIRKKISLGDKSWKKLVSKESFEIIKNSEFYNKNT